MLNLEVKPKILPQKNTLILGEAQQLPDFEKGWFKRWNFLSKMDNLQW